MSQDEAKDKTNTETEFSAGPEKMQKEINKIKKNLQEDMLTMAVFSGDLDKIIAAFIIANSSAALGMEVNMFFTFWGTAALRDPKKSARGQSLIGKMFGIMLPKGFGKLKLSKMHMGGMGAAMIKWLMGKKQIPSVAQMAKMAQDSGVKIMICDMSMNLLGMQMEEMIDYDNIERVGATAFVEKASVSKTTLFI